MIDETFTPFYAACAPARCQFGHIYQIHCYYPHQNLEFFRPATFSNEPTKTFASTFKIETAGADSFKHGHPLSIPKLLSNEEFVVIRAKPRYGVLLVAECPIEGFKESGYHGKIWRPLSLIGQVFGLADTTSGDADFGPRFIERMRKLDFPQLMFLPQKNGPFTVDSMLRLDECQSVFTAHLKHTGFRLSDDVTNLLRWQLKFLFTGEYDENYAVYRELMLEEPS